LKQKFTDAFLIFSTLNPDHFGLWLMRCGTPDDLIFAANGVEKSGSIP